MEFAPSLTFASARGRLLPRVGPSTDGPTFDIVPGHLAAGLVLDGVDGARAVDERDLRAWQTPFETAMSSAIANLRRRTDVADFHDVATAPGLHAWLGTDGLAASRVLVLRELLRPWPLAGAIVAMPSADQLLVLALSELNALEALATLVETQTIAEALGGRPVTEDLFWHDGVELHLLPVRHTDDGVVLDPPEGFVHALKRLAALELSGPAAEA